MQDLVDRKAIILSEFKTLVPDDILAYELIYFSDLASSIKKERIKAAQEGKRYVS